MKKVLLITMIAVTVVPVIAMNKDESDNEASAPATEYGYSYYNPVRFMPNVPVVQLLNNNKNHWYWVVGGVLVLWWYSNDIKKYFLGSEKEVDLSNIPTCNLGLTVKNDSDN
jgi:hypothetical protein